MNITLLKIEKNFITNKKEVKYVLRNINYTFYNDKTYFILGPSGSGKSTLLSIIGLIDDPTNGEIMFENSPILDKDNFIKEHISYVFQDYNLFEDMSVFDNLSIYEQNEDILSKVLKQFDLNVSLNTPVKYLSGGEKQRLSILRAYLKGSEILLFDEPTGNLDHENSIKIMELIKSLNKNRIVIVVSHNNHLAFQYGDEILFLDNGDIAKKVNVSSIYKLDLLNEGKDAFKQIINLFSFENEINISINYESYSLTRINHLKIIDQIYNKYKNNQIICKINKNDKTYPSIDKKNTALNDYFIKKFSKKNFISKIGRTLFSSILVLISTLMVFLSSNFIFYDTSYYLERNLFNANYNYSTVTYKDKGPNISEGFFIHDKTRNLENYFPTIPIKVFDDEFLSSYTINIYLAKEKEVLVNGEYITVPDKEVMITNYVDAFCLYLSDLVIEDMSFPISKERIYVGEHTFRRGGQSDLRYAFGFVSYEYFCNRLFENNNKYGFLLSVYPEIFGVINNLYGYEYKNQELLLGRKIKNDNEVIINKKVYDTIYLKDNNVLNKTIDILDLANEIYSKKDYILLNLNSIVDKVTIVGVIEDNTSKNFMYFTSNIYKEIINQRFINQYKVSVCLKDVRNLIKELGALNIKLSSSTSSAIYEYQEKYFDSDKMPALISIFIIFSTLFVLTICLWFVIHLKDKLKEINILKCLGFKKTDIIKSIFDISSIVYSAVLIVAFIFGVLITNIINSYRVSTMMVSNISVALIPNILSFVIPIILCTFILSICLFVIFKKVSNSTPYNGLKSNS